MMHNANTCFMGLELLLNGVPIIPSHVLFALVFGLLYVAFSWAWRARTGVVYYCECCNRGGSF